MGVMHNIIWLLVLIGVMILIHELGHFWAARYFDVKVEVFSFGFGPRLFGFRRGETDYRFSALLFGGYIVIQTFLFEESVPGYPSLIVGLMVLGGVQLLMIGIMGEYIGKILSELKQRPVYFVAEHSVKTAETADRGAGPAQAAAE